MRRYATVLPETFQLLRDKRGMSQNDVALATGGRVSLPTIKRIEGAKGPHRITLGNARHLSAALKVNVEDLGKSPEELKDVDAQLREVGYRRIAAVIDGETAWAFQAVERLYGLSVKNQMEMAPLFAALLAEGSLQWREERLASIQDAATRMGAEAQGHLSFAKAVYRVEDGIDAERSSIGKGDIFGQKVGDDAFGFGFSPDKNNPFADYLRMLAARCPSRLELDPLGEGYWKSPEGLPEYRVAPDLLSEITGNDPLAEFALLQHHTRLRDIPTEFAGPETTAKRVEWLISQIPEEIREKERVRIQKNKGRAGDLDLSGLGL